MINVIVGLDPTICKRLYCADSRVKPGNDINFKYLEISMKRNISSVIIILLFFTSLSAKDRLFTFSAGLSSGVPIYGHNSIVSTGSEIEKANRIIFGVNGAINLNLIKQITFYLGNDTLWDLTWNSQEKANKVHVSFPLGIKVYPGLGGFNVGLAYTLGFRADTIKTNAAGEYNGISSWGNGFKIQAEYNFAHEGNSQYYPSIGGYWNLMPRGHDSYDNLIVLYIAANF